MRIAFLFLSPMLLLTSAHGFGQPAALPVSVQIKIDPPVRVVRGGLGASWHAIERPMIGTGSRDLRNEMRTLGLLAYAAYHLRAREPGIVVGKRRWLDRFGGLRLPSGRSSQPLSWST